MADTTDSNKKLSSIERAIGAIGSIASIYSVLDSLLKQNPEILNSIFNALSSIKLFAIEDNNVAQAQHLERDIEICNFISRIYSGEFRPSERLGEIKLDLEQIAALNSAIKYTFSNEGWPGGRNIDERIIIAIEKIVLSKCLA